MDMVGKSQGTIGDQAKMGDDAGRGNRSAKVLRRLGPSHGYEMAKELRIQKKIKIEIKKVAFKGKKEEAAKGKDGNEFSQGKDGCQPPPHLPLPGPSPP